MYKLQLVLIVCLWLGGGGNFNGFAQIANKPAQFGIELFPMPEEIAVNAEFWRKVYADYPTHTVLMHDTEDLSIIYEVIELRGLGDAAVASSTAYRNEWRKLEGIKNEYRAIFNKFANRQLDMSNLSRREQRVVEVFGVNADPYRLQRAANCIRAQQGLKDRFHLGLQRSGLYRDFIEGVFSNEGLPSELIMLPHVESSFNYQAYSKVGAAGIWQFMRSTGKLFMTINYEVDERLDPIRATEAAAKLLQLNYGELDSWPLAITAYNHGLNGMKRAKMMYGNDFTAFIASTEVTARFCVAQFLCEFLAASWRRTMRIISRREISPRWIYRNHDGSLSDRQQRLGSLQTRPRRVSQIESGVAAAGDQLTASHSQRLYAALAEASRCRRHRLAGAHRLPAEI
jgi:hypothetical protein